MSDKKRQALAIAETTFRRYGHHHAAKGAAEKATENFELADKMLEALQESAFDRAFAKEVGIPDWWLDAPHHGQAWLTALAASKAGGGKAGLCASEAAKS